HLLGDLDGWAVAFELLLKDRTGRDTGRAPEGNAWTHPRLGDRTPQAKGDEAHDEQTQLHGRTHSRFLLSGPQAYRNRTRLAAGGGGCSQGLTSWTMAEASTSTTTPGPCGRTSSSSTRPQNSEPSRGAKLKR